MRRSESPRESREGISLPSPAPIQRPGERYQCGSRGNPCHQGPSAAGECPLARLCGEENAEAKIRKRGGGPITPCHPVATWAARRRRWTVGALILLAFALVALFGTPIAPRFVKPGNLSTSHAQILEGDLVGGDCSICHDNVSATTWRAMRESGHALTAGESLTMTQRCVACHHDRIPAELATSAHNLSPPSRVAIARAREQIRLASSKNVDTVYPSGVYGSGAGVWLPPAAISQDEVACSVCHREHHGADADLTAITDARCQTCHQRQFGSFADSHPEFRDWPSSKPVRIAFDHAQHANVHFPKTAEAAHENGEQSVMAFDCRSCHSTLGASLSSSVLPGERSNDPIVSTLPFEVACASCHEETLKVQTASGPALIELPILPPEVAGEVPSWPAEATGSPDGKLSAWMLLLLRDQDPHVDYSALADLSQVDWQSSDNRELAIRLAGQIRRFAIRLSLDGQSYLLSRALAAGADQETASRLASSFPPQLMSDAAVDWFGKPQTDETADADGFTQRNSSSSIQSSSVASDSELLMRDAVETGDDLLTDWSQSDTDGDLLLLDDPSSDSSSDLLGGHNESRDGHQENHFNSGEPPENWEAELQRRFDSARSQALGGWYRDDLTLSIRYRGSGHQDAVLRCLIEMAATSSASSQTMVKEHPAVAGCVSCHVELPWRASEPADLRARLTRFTHRPHLDITVLQNCEHCHTMPDSQDTIPATRSDFEALKKADCAHCHTPNAAGDSCTICHRYHVGDVHASELTTESLQPLR